MDPVCEENLSSLTQSSFLCPMYDYSNGFVWMFWRLFISEGNACLCNCSIISTSASSKSATLGLVLAELSLLDPYSGVPSLGSFPLNMTLFLSFLFYLNQSATATFAFCHLENLISLLRMSKLSFSVFVLIVTFSTSEESGSTGSS